MGLVFRWVFFSGFRVSCPGLGSMFCLLGECKGTITGTISGTVKTVLLASECRV